MVKLTLIKIVKFEMRDCMKEKSEDKNFMVKLATFIVDKRNLFF